tara:strand:- start:100 stop:216 length:117 start_codon:yes stop_codon:yes gene_type:complete
MKYIDYLIWRIELLKYDNIILFPMEKTIEKNENEKTEN